MTTICKFTRSLDPITDWDTDDASLSNRDVVPVAPDRSSEVNSHTMQLFVTSLLDHLAAIYEQDPRKREKLVKTMHDMLVAAKIISDTRVPECVSINQQYRRTFVNFVQSAMAFVNQEVSNVDVSVNFSALAHTAVEVFRPNLAPVSIPFKSWLNSLSSKFVEDFTNITKIGEGAFGAVFKGKKKSDGVTYAIKKINFKLAELHEWKRHETFREVKCLAELSHPNIVRYYDYWVEQTLVDAPLVTDTDVSDDEGSSRQRSSSVQCSSRQTDDHSSDPSSPEVSSSTNGHGILDRLVASRQLPTPRLFYVLHIQMELCSSTLKQWLDDRNQNPNCLKEVRNTRDNRRILKQMLKGIEYIHSNGILHRDIKPLNIFLKQVNGQVNVSIGDFGLARHVMPEQLNTGVNVDLHATVSSTPRGSALTTGRGTDLYSAPEQLSGTDYSNKSDMYSIGLVICELYSTFSTDMERHRTLKDLRMEKIDERLQDTWPMEASVICDLTHLNPDLRPSATDVLKGGLFVTKDEIIKELRRDRDETRASDRQRIQALQDQVAQRDRRIDEQHEQVTQRDRRIEEQVTQMDRRIEEQVTQRDRRIASLERRLSEQDQELGRLRISSQQN